MGLLEISLIDCEVEHIFICVLAVLVFSSVKCLLMFFAHFSIRLFGFFLLVYRSYLYMLNNNPCLLTCCNTFSQFVVFFFFSILVFVFKYLSI